MNKKPGEGTVTVMVTDVEASTERAVREGDAKARRAMRSHDSLVRKAIRKHSGTEVDSAGDGFVVVFDSARRAIACAIDIHRSLDRHSDQHPDKSVRVRIGINAGDVIREGERVFGATVNAAARVASLAEGGQVLVSEVVRQLAGTSDEIVFEDRGLHSLKGFPETRRLYRAIPKESSTTDGTQTTFLGARIRVLIVDDEALVRAGFRMILEPQPDIEVVGEAKDGVDAVELANSLRPDVVLMDVRMPRLSGLEATAKLTEVLGRPTRVLMLTTFDLDEYVYEALRVGASGFLLKDTPPEQLINAVHVVATGEALLAPKVTRRLIEQFASAPRPEPGSLPDFDRLTKRELEVLKLLCRGMSTSEMAEQLFVSETTVKTHVARILTKLGLRDRAQAVVLGYESGLIQPGSTA